MSEESFGPGRVPPQSIEAEEAVLGAILLDNRALDRANEIVQADDFYRESHRRIFRALNDLDDRRERADVITLAECLKRRGDLAAVDGAAALAELVEHDPGLVVGVLGGSAGTTRDTFELLLRAETHGARVALFGRKVQHAESQVTLLALMRRVLERELTPTDAVKAYHAALRDLGLAAVRPYEADLVVTDPVLRAE